MSITIDGSTNTITSSAAAITVPAFTTLSSTGNSTLGDSATLDAHALTGKTTANDIRLAAVSASLPALTFVDACFHLAKDDTDKGAWRKRKGQSWRSEARSAGKYVGTYSSATNAYDAGGAVGDVFYNTTAAGFYEITAPTTGTVTYRAGREDYPTNALLTLEAGRFIVWDLDGPIPSMWGVWIGNVFQTLFGSGTVAGSCLAAKNNVIAIGTAGFGVSVVDMLADTRITYHSAATANTGTWTRTLASGHATLGPSMGDNPLLVNATINSVAITVQSDAPLDRNEMPVPTIAVATDDGVSVINNNGVVADLVDVAGDNTEQVVFDRNNNVYFTNSTQGDLDMFLASNYDADDTTPDANYDNTTIPALLAAMTTTRHGMVAAGRYLAIGHSTGLTRLVPSPATKANGMVSYATSAYLTGWMVGDIRRCFLANSKTADRSVKAATLTEVGTVTETTYSGGRSVYSGFSAANYFQEASHADWNALGTGDFSILMSGVKWGTGGVTRKMITLGDLTAVGHWSFQISASNSLVFYINDGTSNRIACTATTATFSDTAEHVVELSRSGTTTYIKVDGVVVSSLTGGYAALSMSASAQLTIGTDSATASPWTGGQVSCVRISATAPTAEQSKYIVSTENALNGGNTCLLSNSSTVSAIGYAGSANALTVGNGTNVDTFQGLKRIASAAHGVTTLTALAAADGRTLTAGTGATYAAPERNISAELLEQQPVVKKEQQYSFTTPAATTTQALPMGWKARGIAFNTTDSTFLGTYTQSFDGFVWTMAGLTASKAYQINLVEA